MKEDENLEVYFGPVRIFPNVSKIFEWFIFRQILKFMKAFFSKQECGCTKGYGTRC